MNDNCDERTGRIDPIFGLQTPLLFAHRGGAKEAPESTVAAFQHAISNKADVLELDVQVTKDQKIVVWHGPKLDNVKIEKQSPSKFIRFIKRKRKIWHYNFEEELRGKAWVAHPQIKEEDQIDKIPENDERQLLLLGEFFDFLNDVDTEKKIPLNIELKGQKIPLIGKSLFLETDKNDNNDNNSLLERFKQILDEKGTGRKIIVACTSGRVLREFDRINTSSAPHFTNLSICEQSHYSKYMAKWYVSLLCFICKTLGFGKKRRESLNNIAFETSYGLLTENLVKKVREEDGSIYVFLTKFFTIKALIKCSETRKEFEEKEKEAEKAENKLKEEIFKILNTGVDGIMTDYPKKVHKIIREWKPSESERAKSFDKVLKDELNEIHTVRELKNDIFYSEGDFKLPLGANGKDEQKIEAVAARTQLAGLAFSGGGIRSATFNLGILQGLAKYNILPRIDYLSTVSGGGYIGSWFTTWIKRCGLRNVIECMTKSSDEAHEVEPKPIRHLREFSNYLTPKVGLLNADAMTAATIYLRNLFLNLIIVVALLGVFVMLPRFISFSFDTILNHSTSNGSKELEVFATIFGLIALLMSYVAVYTIYKNYKTLKESENNSEEFFIYPKFIKLLVVLPLFFSCLLIAASLIAQPTLWRNPKNILIMMVAALIFNPFFWEVRSEELTSWEKRIKEILNFKVLLKVLLQELPHKIFILLPTGFGALIVWGLSFINIDKSISDIWTIFGTPLLILIFSICGILYIGLMGKLFGTVMREWLSRLGAWLLIAGASYMVLCWISIYVPNLLKRSDLNFGMLSGWILTTIGGVLAGKSQFLGAKRSPMVSKILAEITPYVFIFGLLILLSWICGSLYDKISEIIFIKPSVNPLLKGYIIIFVLIIIFLAVAIGLSSRVDINAFSMHNFYRNRLIRCYIGASGDNRNKNPWIGFDIENHSVYLSELANNFVRSDQRPDCQTEIKPYYVGPYHILNTTLNLTDGENLDWQKRKALSFIMSPLFCGYDVRANEHTEKDKVNNIASDLNKQHSGKVKNSGFRPTHQYAKNISLGTAMAISGAAVSPSMGHYSSPALAFLMTIFNFRLGQWLGNPKYANNSWKELGPQIGLIYLFWELFSMTNDRRRYIYLSDGGHFENLGLYELVRRRCRYIIVCDAGQDKEIEFKDLGTAIEKCRTDFGIDIEINVDPIRLEKNSDFSNAHCVVGKIKYDQLGPDDPRGILLYIKASLTGDEPSDVIGYATQNKKFPHQSTADQWFDESQFESYRALGKHIAESVFDPLGDPDVISGCSNELIFVELSKHWYPPSEAVVTSFTRHSATLANLYSQIRKDDDLEFLDAQLVPEWEQLTKEAGIRLDYNYWLPKSEKKLRAGFYMTHQMIQLMENVYIDLNLEKEHDHPDNRGWMNIFRTWSWSGMFRVGWSVSAGTFGARFQSFCERQLDLEVGEIVVDENPKSVELLFNRRLKLFYDLQKQRELNFVEEKFLKKFINSLILFQISHNFWSDKLYFPLEYYPLKLKVCLPKRDKHIFFQFGFALMSKKFKSDKDAPDRYSFSKYLIFFRIQDHVRKMGFGRESLVKLLLLHKEDETFIEMYDLSQFEKWQKSEDFSAKECERIIQDPLFPDEDERKKFDILFDSVQKGIGFV